jgi:tRNA-Thr(GGU) m(6)t(6)A37 methyltransferase TsaA
MTEICKIETPFPQKFGTPRQSLLIDEAWGKLCFPKNDFYYEAFRGIENFTHLWLIFLFSEVEEKSFNGLVSPPRFRGKTKLGVYATRSPHRPNRLGLSVVKFDRIEVLESEIILWVKGVDLVNGTPIMDIKPYIPYCDRIDEAKALIFDEKPRMRKVVWNCPYEGNSETKTLIEKVIGLDPRPGQDHAENSSYGVSVAGFNIRFELNNEIFLVSEITEQA